MPHSPTLIYLGIVAAIASLGGLAVAAISYMRTINALKIIIRNKNPLGWSRSSFSSGRPWRSDIVIPDLMPETVYRLILGMTVLDLPDERYRQLLWTAALGIITLLISACGGLIYLILGRVG
jgi:hypothetical protein